jgi:hypothetical protein
MRTCTPAPKATCMPAPTAIIRQDSDGRNNPRENNPITSSEKAGTYCNLPAATVLKAVSLLCA